MASGHRSTSELRTGRQDIGRIWQVIGRSKRYVHCTDPLDASPAGNPLVEGDNDSDGAGLATVARPTPESTQVRGVNAILTSITGVPSIASNPATHRIPGLDRVGRHRVQADWVRTVG